MEGNVYDAIVVGAGPSGSSCALLLARKGARVLLLDKAQFPRDKPCGDAIGGKALNVLAELGLDGELKERGFLRNSGMVFSSPDGTEVEIPLILEGSELAGGFVCRRMDFDSLVFSHAKKACATLEGAEVTDVIFENGRAIGVKARLLGGAEEAHFAKVVIGADGVNSIVARKGGCLKMDPKHYASAVRAYYSGITGLRGNIEVHFLPESMPGYFWIFPSLSSHEANVGVGMLLSETARKKANLQKILGECLKNPKFAGRFSGARLEGAVSGWSLPLASARRRCAGNGFVPLGDAASLVDPFSGEGIGNGMKSAKIAADVIWAALQRGGVAQGDCLEYERRLWEEIGSDVGYSYTMQKILSSQFMLNLAIGKAKRSKWLRNELAGMIASREAKKKVRDPIFYLRMLLA